MRAVIVKTPGDASQLEYGFAPKPVPGPSQLLIRVRGTACNRADTLQRAGRYPAPPGASPLLGLECAGEVVEVGPDCTRSDVPVGSRVMALLGGGGYAQFCVAHEGSVIPVPASLSTKEAAAVVEVFLTAYLIGRQLGSMNKGDAVLIHAGASGVGTALIQLCKLFGAHAIVTVGSDAKAAYCRELGAAHAVNYKSSPDWSASVKAFVKDNLGKEGVDLVLDPVGATYANQNLNVLGMDGRWIFYGSVSAARASTQGNCRSALSVLVPEAESC